MNVESTNKVDDVRDEYRRETLGRGVRGKYFARYSRGTNRLLLDERVAKAFPTAEAVNAALLELIELATRTTPIGGRSGGHGKARN